MPLAILEAQATGLPCIVSNIQGNNNLVSHNKNGLLFDLNKPEQLTKQILLLIEKSSLRMTFGHEALIDISGNHDVNKRVQYISQSYMKFVNDHYFLSLRTLAH